MKPKLKFVDSQTSEVIEREMTDEEYQEHLEYLQHIENEKEAAAEKEAQKQSAKDKLTALGLTPGEIAALTGA